jgi:hypothetical protein
MEHDGNLAEIMKIFSEEQAGLAAGWGPGEGRSKRPSPE